MAQKTEVHKPVEPMEPIETTTSSRIKINAVYEDAKDVHVRNYILYTGHDGADNYLYLDETSTERIDCDTLMDFCSKGVLIYVVFRGTYSKVIDFARVVNGTLEKYAYCKIFADKGAATFYSKEHINGSGEIVNNGSGKENNKN